MKKENSILKVTVRSKELPIMRIMCDRCRTILYSFIPGEHVPEIQHYCRMEGDDVKRITL